MIRTNSPPQRRTASKKTGGSPWLVHAIGIALFCAVAGTLIAIWWRGGLPERPDVAYTQFGPIRVTNKGYAMSATLSLETDKSGAQWARENSPLLQQTLQQALEDTDVQILRNPDGVQRLQEKLEQAVNAVVPGPHTQRVFVTDLIYQEDE